jgi:hypothetical protein
VIGGSLANFEGADEFEKASKMDAGDIKQRLNACSRKSEEITEITATENICYAR